MLPGSPKLFGIVGASNTRTPPTLTRAMCTHSLPRVRLTLVRRPAVAATGRRLHLYHYGRRLSSSVGDAAAVLSPMRPIGGSMRRMRMCHTHVHGSPR